MKQANQDMRALRLNMVANGLLLKFIGKNFLEGLHQVIGRFRLKQHYAQTNLHCANLCQLQ
ncbi:hypothetical protein AN687_01115 [Klebsiella variicola]|nr:hypothetical protein AN687_01115 [Klebsiella variicola]